MVSSISSTSSAQSALIQALQQRLQDKFKTTDSDGDGKLTLDEFKAGAPQGANAPQGAPALDEIFASLDSNSDGSISQDEFTTGLASQGPPPGGKISGNNTLQLLGQSDEDLLASILKALESSSDATAADDTSKTDTASALFDFLDRDGDNSVSAEELKTGMAQIRTEMMNTLLTAQSDTTNSLPA